MKQILILVILGLTACSKAPVNQETPLPPETATPTVRIASFNVSLYRDETAGLIEDLSTPGDPQIEAVAEIIRRVDPDILVLKEFDYDADGTALALFQKNYLTVDGRAPYPYALAFPSNTGVSSGIDLDGNGKSVTTPGTRDYGGDSFGYGIHEGQYAFALLSRMPLETQQLRSFRQFLWKDMPANVMPVDWYLQEAQNVFRLSSKNHVDIPVTVDGQLIHLLIAHPTPPAFDGPEDRNGRRNHDEIRLWADYIDPVRSAYLVDDKGRQGGLASGERFVILGDLNADPNDGDSFDQAIHQLTDHPLIQDPLPTSAGGADAARRQGGVNAEHRGVPETDTADFRDEGNGAIGNLRIDYALPSVTGLTVEGAGVFWPAEGEDGFDLVGPGFPPVSSDHRLIWVDLRVTPTD